MSTLIFKPVQFAFNAAQFIDDTKIVAKVLLFAAALFLLPFLFNLIVVPIVASVVSVIVSSILPSLLFAAKAIFATALVGALPVYCAWRGI